MKDKEPTYFTDDLLRSSLGDDLPPETERALKERLLRFREEVGETGRRKKAWFQPQWVIAREALALVAVVMISVGGFLHVAGHRNAMADTFSFLHFSVTVSEHVSRAISMECAARVRGEDGRSLDYTIRWVGPDRSRVDVREATTTLRTYSSSREMKGDDPLLEPVSELLTPVALSDAIYEKWQPKRFGDQSGEKITTLVYVNGKGETLLEMDVDITTYLPRRIKKDVVEAHFTWNDAVSPEFLMPNEEGS
jgi:hypothetical protein